MQNIKIIKIIQKYFLDIAKTVKNFWFLKNREKNDNILKYFPYYARILNHFVKLAITKRIFYFLNIKKTFFFKDSKITKQIFFLSLYVNAQIKLHRKSEIFYEIPTYSQYLLKIFKK